MTESDRLDVIRCRSQNAKIQLLTNQPGQKGVCSEAAGERWGSVGAGERNRRWGAAEPANNLCGDKLLRQWETKLVAPGHETG